MAKLIRVLPCDRPANTDVCEPAHGGAGRGFPWRRWIAVVLYRLGFPGLVWPTVVHDPTTGQTLALAVGPHYVRITVDGRDYYFDRLTGRYDGTGQPL